VSDVERGLRTLIYRDTAARIADALDLGLDERVGFEAAARGRPGPLVTSKFPALPRPIAALLGREPELELITSALIDDGVRLLTLTGPGGIGKTRLAVEAAHRIGQYSAADPVFVSLGAITDPALVPSAVATAVGLRQPREPIVEALQVHLSDRRLALVLDTFEHVMAAAPFVANLLGGCPHLSIMVTSRAALRIRGEHELPLAPLPHDPAGALFAERAHAIQPQMSFDATSAAIVNDICRALDGLPLAIELAAARVKHLPLAGIRDRLDDQLALLRHGPRDLRARQQSMRATVAWSFALLSESDQLLLCRLSVFAGGWTLGSAQAICAPGEPEVDVLTGISSLVDQNMIIVRPEHDRYGMLDVIREYAVERLDERTHTHLTRRHAEHFLTLAEESGPPLAADVYRRLENDLDNLRRAFRTAVDDRPPVMALRLAGAMWMFWRQHGGFTEGRAWLDAALKQDDRSDLAARARALWGAGWMAYHQGEIDETAGLATELLALADAYGSSLDTRNGLTLQGMIALAEGRFVHAVELFERSVGICRRQRDSWLVATSAFNLGVACICTGDVGRAELLIGEAHARHRELGDDSFCARDLAYLARIALGQGETERALAIARHALQTSMRLAEQWGVAESLEVQSVVLAAAREDEKAAMLAGAADALRTTIESQPYRFEVIFGERYLSSSRARLGPESWQSYWVAGRNVDPDQLLCDHP
jgi:predicted ATPase